MIIGFLGNLGRGKTLSMTFLMALVKHNTKISNVVTNYQTDITTHHVKNSQELDDMSNRDNFTAIYGLDEMWAWMNARKTQENFDMVEFVLNSRKRGCVIFYTTQSERQVDPILTDNTDYVVVPIFRDKLDTGKEYDTVEIYIIQRESLEIVNNIVINAEMYYNKYDTSEEISTVTDKEKYEDIFDEYKVRVNKGEFQSKTELVSHLNLTKDILRSKAVRITDEIFRELRNSGDIE